MTLAATPELDARVARAIQESFDAVVVSLEAGEESTALMSLSGQQNILVVVAAPDASLVDNLRRAGGRIVSAGEPEYILQASLLSLPARQQTTATT